MNSIFEGRPDTGPVWRLPGNRTKTGKPLTIPLVPEVIEWLQAFRLTAGGSIRKFEYSAVTRIVNHEGRIDANPEYSSPKSWKSGQWNPSARSATA